MLVVPHASADCRVGVRGALGSRAGSGKFCLKESKARLLALLFREQLHGSRVGTQKELKWCSCARGGTGLVRQNTELRVRLPIGAEHATARSLQRPVTARKTRAWAHEASILARQRSKVKLTAAFSRLACSSSRCNVALSLQGEDGGKHEVQQRTGDGLHFPLPASRRELSVPLPLAAESERKVERLATFASARILSVSSRCARRRRSVVRRSASLACPAIAEMRAISPRNSLIVCSRSFRVRSWTRM